MRERQSAKKITLKAEKWALNSGNGQHRDKAPRITAEREEAGWANDLFIVSGNASCLSVPVKCINETEGY